MEDLEDENENLNIREELKTKYKIFILEPAILLIFYAWNVSGTVLTDEIVYQSCVVVFGFNTSQCELLGNGNETQEIRDLEATVQPFAANILMVKTWIESVVPAICCPFIGPWSDKYGRRPVIILMFVGYFITHSLMTFVCFLSSVYAINPWIYVFTFIPANIVGGNGVLTIVIFCYVADVSSARNRAFKMGVLEVSMFVGMVLGSFSSSFILNLSNATVVFAISTAAILIGTLYIIIYIEESIRIIGVDNKKTQLREIFRIELLYEMFKTCLKKRNHYNRAILWMIITSMSAMFFAIKGSQTIYFLFVREKFGWTVKEFTFYDSANTILMTIGNFVGIYCMKKWFDFSDVSLTAIAFLSAITDSLFSAFATASWHLYLGITVSFMKGIEGATSMAILSNSVPANEMGKVYSMNMFIESLAPLISSPIYTAVYDKTLTTFTGAFNLISVLVLTICLFIIIVMYILQRRPRTYGYAEIEGDMTL